jgi:hypothetical protein
MRFLFLILLVTLLGCSPSQPPATTQATSDDHSMRDIMRLTATPGRFELLQHTAMGESVLFDTGTGDCWIWQRDTTNWLALPNPMDSPVTRQQPVMRFRKNPQTGKAEQY